MTRDWLTPALALVLALGAFTWWTHQSRLRGVADAYAAEARSATAARDSIRRERLADSVTAARELQAVQDSLARVRAEREAERARLRAVTATARARGDSLAREIVRVAPEVEATVRELQAEHEAERQAWAGQVLSLEAQLAEERDLWAITRDVLEEQAEGLRVELGAADEVIRLQDAEIDALRGSWGGGLGRALRCVGLAGAGAGLGAWVGDERGAIVGGAAGAVACRVW